MDLRVRCISRSIKNIIKRKIELNFWATQREQKLHDLNKNDFVTVLSIDIY